jgi:hypothetical protein
MRPLLEYKADVEAKVYGRMALRGAARNGHDAVERLLLEHKKDVDAKDSDRRCAWRPGTGTRRWCACY